MTAWTVDELHRIGAAEELEIAPLRSDGTLQNPVTSWVVRVGDDLYVLPRKGAVAPGIVQRCRAGKGIAADSIEKDVAFMDETDTDINAQIDTAYHTQYARYPQYVAPMVVPEPRDTTLRLVPS